MTRFLRLTVLVAAFAAIAAPALAVTNGQTGRMTFATQLMDNEPDAAGGAYDGVLNLTVASDGTVSGLYREVDRGLEKNVIGGVRGNAIWLDIGGANPLHIDGKLQNGTIVGYTTIGADVYKFSADATPPQL